MSRRPRSTRPAAAVVAASLATATLAIGPPGAGAAQHSTARVSSDPGANESNNASFTPATSGDGRYVAFLSDASNLVPGDTNRKGDIFVRDTRTGKTTRVSVSSTGMQANENSYNPSISEDGRFVTFDSFASNLVPGDLNRRGDVFLHDRVAGTTVRVTNGFDGKETDGQSGYGSISGDGRYVVFESLARNLIPNKTNMVADIYVWDRTTGKTELASQPLVGRANGSSGNASISGDGRFVAFASSANNMVPGDYNNASDVFLRDRQAGTTTRVSITNIGQETNAASDFPVVSDDGRFVAYESTASNLLSTDLLQLDHAKLLPNANGNPLTLGDTNYESDVFLRDMRTGLTELISISSDGVQGEQGSYGASISGDGTKVAFTSRAPNLVANDTNGMREVFLRDRTTGETTRASVGDKGQQGNGISVAGAISRDGTRVAFTSDSSNLVPRDRNREGDIFVRG